MARIATIAIAALALAGCWGEDALVEKTESLKVESTLKESSKRDTEGSINVKYPAGATMDVRASGNAQVSVSMIPPEGQVSLGQAEKLSTDEDSEQSFSVDAFLASVPTWLYVAMLFLGIIAAIVLWIVIKTTAAGRATDKLLAGGLTQLGGVLKIGDRYLRNMIPQSAEYRAVKEFMEEVRQVETDEARKTRGNSH